MRTIFILILTFTLVGCATAKDSTLLGMTIGGSVGGLMGNAQSENRDKSTMVGAALGAAIGGLIGYSAHKNKKKTDVPNLPGKNPFDVPMVTRPKVNCTLVEDEIQGNKWIEKHHICIIESPSTWSR